MTSPYLRRPLDHLDELNQYEARAAQQLQAGHMLADARSPFRSMTSDELEREKRESDQVMREVAEVEQRLFKAMEAAAIDAISAQPERVRKFFEAGDAIPSIQRNAYAEQAQARHEALAYELDERRMDEEDAALHCLA